MNNIIRYPIRMLSEKTNVGTSTLRAWERRYGLLQPERTPKGHRLYSDNDVNRVLRICDLLNDGHALATIVNILKAEQNQFLQEDDINSYHKQSVQSDLTQDPEARQSASSLSIWDKYIQSTLAAVDDLSIERTEAIYNEVSGLYPIDMITEKLVEPVLKVLGNLWKQEPDSGIAKEHFYIAWLKNRIAARFHHAYSQARGRRIVCACLEGIFHEVGLMLFALSALSHGYRVQYYGVNLPVQQLPYIVDRSAADALVLSSHMSASDDLIRQLKLLISKIEIPVFIGGINPHLDSGSINKSGAIILGDQISVALHVLESYIPVYSRK